MQPAAYRDIDANNIPSHHGNGFTLRHIAGSLTLSKTTSQGAINDTDGQQLSTQPIYAGIRFTASQTLQLELPADHNGLVYCYDGSVDIEHCRIRAGTAAVLSHGDRFSLNGL